MRKFSISTTKLYESTFAVDARMSETFSTHNCSGTISVLISTWTDTRFSFLFQRNQFFIRLLFFFRGFFRFEIKCTSISVCLHLLVSMRCSLHCVRFIHYYYYVKINFLTWLSIHNYCLVFKCEQFSWFYSVHSFSSMQINFSCILYVYGFSFHLPLSKQFSIWLHRKFRFCVLICTNYFLASKRKYV